MINKRLLIGGFGICSAVAFAPAMIFPIMLSIPFAGDVSFWAVSPLISIAAIILVAILGLLPLWWKNKRAWILPLICGLVILSIDIALFVTIALRMLINPSVTAKSILSVGGNAGAGISLIPIYLMAVSATMQLSGAMVVRKVRRSSSATDGK